MFRNVTITGGGFAVVILLAIVCQFAFAGAEQGRPTEPFDGKVVLFDLNRSKGMEGQQYTIILKNPELVEIGDAWFVRGTGYGVKATDSPMWVDGLNGAYRWDDVVDYITFKDVDDVEKFYTSREDTEE